MCGIFGAIGSRWDLGTVRALAIINRERGTDSLGFFNSFGSIIKCAEDPLEALRRDNISTWLYASAYGDSKRGWLTPAWFIGGHTRLATRGKVNKQNSHPFHYGNIIGTHNGIVDAPNKYDVDSQYLFDTLNKADGDYNVAWSKISGYWALAWFDMTSLFLQTHNGELSVANVDGTYYYSSRRDHLAACIGHTRDVITLTDGQTLKFSIDESDTVTMKETTPFKSRAPTYWSKYYACSTSDWDENEDNHYFQKLYGKSLIRDYSAWSIYTKHQIEG